MRVKSVLFGALVLLTLTGCIAGGDDNGDEPGGQLTRPGEAGLPLDNAASVGAFDVADDFLVEWFFLEDVEGALTQVHPNFRDTWRPLLEETEIERDCSLRQTQGTTPDQSGAVTARYVIGGCKVTSPGGLTAVYVELIITPGDDRPWISQIEFLR